MIVAEALGFEYIHVPLHHLAHQEKDTSAWEDFFSLGTTYRHYKWQQDKSITLEKRVTHDLNRGCGSVDFLRGVETRKMRCSADDRTLYWNDNCWNRLYCHGLMESGFAYKLIPQFQRGYHSHPKPDPCWLDGFAADQEWGKHVVIHWRLGDGSFVNINYFLDAIRDLRIRLRKEANGRPPLFRIQTDGLKKNWYNNIVSKHPILNDTDIVVDFGRERNANGTSLQLSMHRMISADALVMSKSALSMVAGFIGNQSVVFLPGQCWDRTPLPHWTKRNC